MNAESPEGSDLYTEAAAALDGWYERGVGKTVCVKRYEHSARKYDQYSKSLNYQGPSQLAKTMMELYPSNRDVIKIIDVASGTGLSGLAEKLIGFPALERFGKIVLERTIFPNLSRAGKAMWEAGFRQMDAVDPSQGMLDVAKNKNIYNKMICDFVDDEHQLDIRENTYDAVTIAGGMGENHLLSGAFGEIIRVVKPGGVVVNVTRIEHFTITDDYRNNLTPYFRKLEDDGKWKEVSRASFPTNVMDKEGIVIVHRIMS